MVPLGLVCGEKNPPRWLARMDRCIQMWKCGRIRNACAHACTECWREMGGGGGHLMGAPTNQKDGLWGQWWAKLPRVLEWQGRMGGSKCSTIWLEMEVGVCACAKQCRGELESGGGPLGAVFMLKHSRV